MIYKNRRLRHELKYLITPHYYEIIRNRTKNVLAPDKNSGENGEYRVTSLYFDDIYRSAYNDKMLGLKTRRKYRIRSYNLSPDLIFLEAKYKDCSYVSKKNAKLSICDYRDMLRGNYTFFYNNEEEFNNTALSDFITSNTVSMPRPSVAVDYFREAYVADTGNVRLTFDKKLSVGCGSLDIFSTDIYFSPIFNDRDYIILELKFDDFLPDFIGDLLTGLPLHEEAISKFVLCTDKLLEVKKQCIF